MKRRSLSIAGLCILVSACTAENEKKVLEPGSIVTVAGSGLSAYDGDGLKATESALYSPMQVFFGDDGRPQILDWNNHRVREILADGTLETTLGTGIEVAGGTANEVARTFPIHHPF